MAELKGERLSSNIVGSGRDVMAKTKDNDPVRIFLMVERIDQASGRVADCLFMAKMVHVAEAAMSVSHAPQVLAGAVRWTGRTGLPGERGRGCIRRATNQRRRWMAPPGSPSPPPPLDPSPPPLLLTA